MLAALVLVSCGGFRLKSSTLRSYAEPGAGGSGIVLNLSRDQGSVMGTWEDPSLSRYGVVEGDAKADATFSLRFYASNTEAPVGTLQGSWIKGESRMKGVLQFGGGTPRDLELETAAAPTANLVSYSAYAESRKGLPKAESDPTRFYYFGFEPGSPAELRSWYRKTFQGGKDLRAAVATERDTFIKDFDATTKDRAAQMAPELLRPWYYEGRQFLSFRGKDLLVMGLRRGIYTGSEDMSQSLRYAVIDEKERTVLGPGDFLAAGWQEALPALLAASAREELGLAPDAPLAENGLNSNTVSPSGDFFVYSKGMGFHYVPGKLAPAEAGEFFLLLPFDRLNGLVRPDVLARYGMSVSSR
jgi:hypothetical protein